MANQSVATLVKTIESKANIILPTVGEIGRAVGFLDGLTIEHASLSHRKIALRDLQKLLDFHVELATMLEEEKDNSFK